MSTPGDMRAPGASTGVAVLEVAMDELAYEIGIDRVELRVRNFVHRDHDNNKQPNSSRPGNCIPAIAKVRKVSAGQSVTPNHIQ